MSAAEFKYHFHFEALLLAVFLGLVAGFSSDPGIGKIAIAIGVWALGGLALGVFVERRNRRRDLQKSDRN